MNKMAESTIKIYKGTVTAGGIDGTLVSSGTDLVPIESGTIKIPTSGYQEGSWIKLAIRCDSGYETVENISRHARISIISNNPEESPITNWQLAPDSEGEAGTPEVWGDPLDFFTKIGDKNVLFWARARAAYTEEPINDAYVQIKASVTMKKQ
jgi:hypothetical protein